MSEEMDFAKALKKLEEIVKSLETGELSLEESLAKFEEGIGLARRLESILDRAEQKVQEILAK
ncbi:MAG: exodeoxyribonuclease VII small subunit [Bacillota bacterium]|jgi:exodeoxyribonuclease VII small subunit